MLACPWPSACQGGDGSIATTTNGRRLSTALVLTDDAAGCTPGYTGPLCAVCAHNFYFASITSTCEACGNNGTTQLSLMVVIPLLFIAVVVTASLKFRRKHVEEEGALELAPMTGGSGVEPVSHEDEEMHSSARVTGDSGTGMSGAGVSMKSLKLMFQPVIETGSAVASLVGSVDRGLLMPIVKIMMTVFQIVSNLPAAIDLQFPHHVTRLFVAFAFVNFTSMNFGSPQCYYKYDYVDLLMLQTLAPLVLIGLLFLAYLVDHRCRAVPLERSNYVTWFFLITYLVLPRYRLMLLHLRLFLHFPGHQHHHYHHHHHQLHHLLLLLFYFFFFISIFFIFSSSFSITPITPLLVFPSLSIPFALPVFLRLFFTPSIA